MYKLAFLLFLGSALAENSCDCSGITIEQSEQETNDIVAFLNRLAESAPTEEEKYPAMPAAAISGSLGCQCENLRKKRKITPDVGIPLEDMVIDGVKFSKGNCPKDHVRFQGLCKLIAELTDY